jgi:hypothetical protein
MSANSRTRREGLPSRAEQITKIFESEAYKSGRLFDKREMALVIGMTETQASNLLVALAVEGYLNRYEAEEGNRGKGSAITFRKRARIPPGMKIRQNTDAQLQESAP